MKLSESQKQTLSLIAVCLLAALAAICFRSSMGLVAMFPVLALCALTCAFVKYGVWQKAIIFTLLSLLVNLLGGAELTETLVLSVITCASCIFACLCVLQAKKNKLIPAVIFAVALLLFTVLGMLYLGNPISALKANGDISSYINSTYDDENITVSNITYGYKTASYYVTVVSDNYPTEKRHISAKNGIVKDNYKPFVQQCVTEQTALDLTSVLREAFPNDSFEVESLSVSGTKPLIAENTREFAKCTSYAVYLGGKANMEAFKKAVDEYIATVRKSGFDFVSITFSCGRGLQCKTAVTVYNYFIPTYKPGVYLPNHTLLNSQFDSPALLDFDLKRA